MHLDNAELELFFRLHRSLMFVVNQRLKVIPGGVTTPEGFSALSPELRFKVRVAWLENLELTEVFASENPYRFSDEELAIVRSWRHVVTGRFYVFRDLKKYTSKFASQYVIELRGDTLDAVKIKEGDKVELVGTTWDTLKKQAQ